MSKKIADSAIFCASQSVTFSDAKKIADSAILFFCIRKCALLACTKFLKFKTPQFTEVENWHLFWYLQGEFDTIRRRARPGPGNSKSKTLRNVGVLLEHFAKTAQMWRFWDALLEGVLGDQTPRIHRLRRQLLSRGPGRRYLAGLQGYALGCLSKWLESRYRCLSLTHWHDASALLPQPATLCQVCAGSEHFVCRPQTDARNVLHQPKAVFYGPPVRRALETLQWLQTTARRDQSTSLSFVKNLSEALPFG